MSLVMLCFGLGFLVLAQFWNFYLEENSTGILYVALVKFYQ